MLPDKTLKSIMLQFMPSLDRTSSTDSSSSFSLPHIYHSQIGNVQQIPELYTYHTSLTYMGLIWLDKISHFKVTGKPIFRRTKRIKNENCIPRMHI